MRYLITFICKDAAALVTLMAFTSESISTFTVKSVEALADTTPTTDAVATTKSSTILNGSRYRDGRRDKGILGTDLLIRTLRVSQDERGVHQKNMLKVFEERGFSKNSLSPILSKIERSGRVVYNRETGWISLNKSKPTKFRIKGRRPNWARMGRRPTILQLIVMHADDRVSTNHIIKLDDDDLMKTLVHYRYKALSATSKATSAVDRGLLTRIDQATYRITDKGHYYAALWGGD